MSEETTTPTAEVAVGEHETHQHDHDQAHLEAERRAHQLSMQCWRVGQRAATAEEWAKAVEHGRAAAELSPHSPEVRFNLGVALIGHAAATGDAASRLAAAESFARGQELAQTIAGGREWARYTTEAIQLLEKREPQLGREPAFAYALGTHLGALGKIVRARRILAVAAADTVLGEVARTALEALPEPTVPRAAPAGRNDPCPCGSGKKYKKCHGAAA